MLTHIRSGSLVLAPDPLLRAYLDLVHTVFVDLRSSDRMGDLQGEYVRWLAQAMHNISSLIAKYDCGYVNDEKFRRMYLRPFDEYWRGKGNSPLRLEEELDEALSEIQNSDPRSEDT